MTLPPRSAIERGVVLPLAQVAHVAQKTKFVFWELGPFLQQIESFWKNKLLSRSFGLNVN